jgi:hypothetical protein
MDPRFGSTAVVEGKRWEFSDLETETDQSGYGVAG